MPRLKSQKKKWTPKDSDILEPDMKRSVYLELVGSFGTAMSLQEVADYMGCGDDTARKAMKGVMRMGDTTKYRSLAVAERIVTLWLQKTS